MEPKRQTERSETVIEITPCLLGFAVTTYNVRVIESEDGFIFTQGQGFKREQGVFTASALIEQLILEATCDLTSEDYKDFQVRLK